MATKTGSERRTAGGSCFKEVEVLLTLALPPSGLRDINAAVCNHLNQSLMKYVALEGGAGGVLVAYWGVALEGSCARIMYEQPELHCRVRLRALFFAPSPGLTLVGEVNKVGSDHVGLLVAGAFNASVSRDAVPADFVSVTTAPSSAAKDEDDNEEKEDDEEEEDEEEAKKAAAPVTTVECWRSTSDPTRELSPGRFAALQTTAVTTSRGIITIFGSMLAPRTGPLLHVAGEVHESESRHEQHQEAEESEETAVTAASPGSKKKKKEKKEKEEKKKPSKRKAKEEAEEEEEEAAPVKAKEEAKPKTPKKKKRRVSEQ